MFTVKMLNLYVVGSLLADLSVSQSEDDLDVRDAYQSREWKRQRPSLTGEGDASSAKRRRSVGKDRGVTKEKTLVSRKRVKKAFTVFEGRSAATRCVVATYWVVSHTAGGFKLWYSEDC